MSNNVREIIYLLVLGDQDVGKTLMVSRMIGDLPILHLSEDNHSNPVKYLVMPEMGSPLKLELVLQECSTSGELSKIIAKNSHFPKNVVLMFHCGSDTSFESCEVFYKMIQEHHQIQCNFLWIANTDCSFGGTSGWEERISRLVDESESRFLQTSLMEPHRDFRNVIRSFFADISKNNQLVMEPQVRSWIDGRDDVKEKSQELIPVRNSASWSNWSFDTMQDKEDAVETLVDWESWQGLNSGKSDDEVGETAAQSDCIPSTTLRKGYGAEEKPTKREGSSTSNETSGWYPDDEGESWVEWTAYWSTSVEWLRHLCFSCVDRR